MVGVWSAADTTSLFRDVTAVIGVLWLSWLTLKALKALAGDLCAFFLAPLGISRINLKKYGSWAVITGASEGIGRGYALELARQGLNVVIMSRSQEKLQKVADEIKQKHSCEVLVIQVDFSRGMEIYPNLTEQLKNLDVGVLVNNVGIAFESPNVVHERSADGFHKMITVNCQSMVQMVKLVLPRMLNKRKGIIVNLSSCVSSIMPPMLTGYAATKSFVDSFSDGLYREYTSRGIVVQCVSPFYVTTAMSGIDSANFWVAEPVAFARAAMATTGIKRFTHGCFSHAIQGYISRGIPSFLMDHFLWKSRTAAKERYLRKNTKH